MPYITLTESEAAMLKEALEIYVSDLRMEIVDTEEKDFREDLKHREAVLNRVLMALAGETATLQSPSTT
jgi:hypothetical protein